MYAAVLLCLCFCSMKYSYFCGTTCNITKSHPPAQTHGLGLWHHFISIQPTFIKQLLCARGWAYMDPSSTVSALKSSQYCNNFLNLSGEYFCLSEVFPGPRSPPPPHPRGLKWLLTSLNSWLCSTRVPRRMRGPADPCLEVKAPKHKTVAIWPLRWVIRRRWLHCKWPLRPVCGSQKCVSVSCTPVVGDMEEKASHLKGMCPWAPPGGIEDPYKDSLPRADPEEVTCHSPSTALYFHMWPCALVLVYQIDCKLLENTPGS